MTEKTSGEKIAALRGRMKENGLDGYLVPRADEFQGEYVPACAERLSWLTGFTGSAGAAAVLMDKACVMSDGRYTLQLAAQTDSTLYEKVNSDTVSLEGWMAANAAPGARIGYDPKLHTPARIAAMEKALKEKNIALVPFEGNLVDAVWDNRPPAPRETAEAYPDALAGRTAAEKREMIAQAVKKEGAHAAVLAAPDSIAWLLNIRGKDVPHNPFALSYAIITDDGQVDWFIDRRKVPSSLAAHLGNHVRVREMTELPQALAEAAQAAQTQGKPVLMDFTKTSIWFKTILEQAGAAVLDRRDPCSEPRACKTESEQKAIREAHVRDGVAVTRFLKWLSDEAPKGKLTELAVERKLLEFRLQDKGLRDTSFDTIAGWAGNGAIVHYRASAATNKQITPPGLLLVDSGGQYQDGTTDITRTISVGTPTEEMRENFTRVLKGHIGIAMLRFPDGVTGEQIDVLARRALWDAGLDYAHGTGHGVGCYLSVHEDGVGISVRAKNKFRPGMLVSNEPGYYKENEYGIRLENLQLVREDGKGASGRMMMRFEPVTLAPFDRALIRADMLEAAELKWLNDYHARVYKTLALHLDADARAWLEKQTAPLATSENPAVKAGSRKKWRLFCGL